MPRVGTCDICAVLLHTKQALVHSSAGGHTKPGAPCRRPQGPHRPRPSPQARILSTLHSLPQRHHAATAFHCVAYHRPLRAAASARLHPPPTAVATSAQAALTRAVPATPSRYSLPLLPPATAPRCCDPAATRYCRLPLPLAAAVDSRCRPLPLPSLPLPSPAAAPIAGAATSAPARGTLRAQCPPLPLPPAAPLAAASAASAARMGAR